MRNYLKTAVDFIDQERSLFAPGWIPVFTGMTKMGNEGTLLGFKVSIGHLSFPSEYEI
jgi:hypothetical protein